jgi:hypothetical protein
VANRHLSNALGRLASDDAMSIVEDQNLTIMTLGVVTGQSSKRVAEMAVRHWAAQLDEEGALA